MTRPAGLAWHLFIRFHGRRRCWLPLNARLWRNRKGRDRRWPQLVGKL